MIRLALILSLALQPLWLVAMHCGTGGPAQQAAATVQSCCAANVARISHIMHCGSAVKACCTGAAACACDAHDAEQPAAPPSRGFGNGADQLLALLRLPTSRTGQTNEWRPTLRFVSHNENVLLPAAASPHAFFCVWLT